ncbi:MAG: hypothetical protein PHI19_06485 [Clostridia bacterium]|nr:hypothetical protein [Clostridia bacterium]
MITESGLQPLLALVFLCGGAIAYLPMIVVGLLPIGERLPVLKHILEGVWGLLFCLIFLALCHFVYDGRVKYFTVLCYLVGSTLSALFLRLPLEIFVRKLHARYLKRKDETEEVKKN